MKTDSNFILPATIKSTHAKYRKKNLAFVCHFLPNSSFLIQEHLA